MKEKYIPDLTTVLRETDPRKLAERRRRAREDAQRLTPPNFVQRVVPGQRSDEGDSEDEGNKTRVSAPSPWAEHGAGTGIDAGALPSAMTPAAAPDEERPVIKRAAEGTRRTWPRTWKLVAAAAAVAMSMPLLVVLAGRTRDADGKAAAASEEPAPNAMVLPHATATVTPSVAAPSATEAPSAAPTTAPRNPHRTPSAASREKDARAAAPLRSTAEPAPPPPPSPPAAVEPTSTPPQTEIKF